MFINPNGRVEFQIIPKKNIKKITEILGINPETLIKELHQFYEARRKELKKRMKKGQGNAQI